MAGNSVGRIDLDLGINTSGFKSQLNGIQKQGNGLTGVFGKLGKVVGAAFAVKAVIDFGKECLKLGSDLQEVQNVVDVTFGSMSGKVDEFAKNAITAYGLSEKVAKEYMGQFGAMSKAFGNGTEAAYAQSEALTALTGDVASFYNLSTDEAFTKLKAVYTGETEALKSLGVVMTQTALDEFALQQGMGKTTKQMSEQEKVSLRLAFVTDRLSAASGDFARTSGGWANQTRVLSLRFDALKASIGQGLINILTPVIQLINKLVAKLQVAADAFRDFTVAIFGDAGGSGASSTLGAAAESAGGIAENIDGAAGSAAKLKKSLMGFDKLNILSSSSSDAGGSGGSSSGGISAGTGETAATEASANSAVGALDSLKKKLKEIAEFTGLDKYFENIKKGIDKIDFSQIKENLQSIGKSGLPIIKQSLDSILGVVKSWLSYVGTLDGWFAALSGKLVEIETGGIAQFLEKDGEEIQKWIDDTGKKFEGSFDNLSFSADNIFGSLWSALDDNEREIQNSMSNVLSSVRVAITSVGTIVSDMWLSLTAGFAEWSSTNKEDIELFFEGVLETVTNFTNSVSTVVSDMFGSISSWWEEKGKPLWDDTIKALTDIGSTVMTFWNTWVKPIIDKIVSKLDEVWKESLKPLWDNLVGFFGDVWEMILALWTNWLKPIVDWIVEKFGPPIVKIISWIVDKFGDAFKTIGKVASGIITSLRGVVQFFTGIFQKDWGKATEGIKTMFLGIWTSISESLAPILNPILTFFENMINNIISGLNSMIVKINKLKIDVPDWVPEIGGKTFGFNLSRIDAVSLPRLGSSGAAASGSVTKPKQAPRLATGGYVRANTPQLAIIGDNKREGEIVAPESKIAEAVARGFAMVLSKMQQGQGSQKGSQTPVIIKIGETDIWQGFIDFINAEASRTGESPLRI